MNLKWSTKISNSPFSGVCGNAFIDKGKEIILPCYIMPSKREPIRVLVLNKETGKYKDKTEKAPKHILIESKNRISPDCKEYKYGNKILKSKNSYNIECIENDKQIWQFRHGTSWLYTDIIVKNGCVIFGTSNGVYCLELETGKLLCRIKDSCSSGIYDWHDENIVTFSKDRIVKVNPFTAEVIDEYKFESKNPYHTIIQVIDNFAYGVIFTNDNQATVLCLDLIRF